MLAPCPMTGSQSHDRPHRLYGPDPWRCTYCGSMVICRRRIPLGPSGSRSMEERNRYGVLDHVIPLARNGPDTADNLTMACWSCNNGKGARLYPGEWIPRADDNTYVMGGRGLPLPSTPPPSLIDAGFLWHLFSQHGWLTAAELGAIGGVQGLVVRKQLAQLTTEGLLKVELFHGTLPVRRIYTFA